MSMPVFCAIRIAMRNGMDTLDIARAVGVRECDVWNALARMGKAA